MNLCPDGIEAVRRECGELVAIFVTSIRTAAGRM
jgi:hypothetical protein